MGKIGLENSLETNTAKASGITPIGKDVVHKICSGQVVLTLAVAVKELLENSLDAGATTIEIRLVDQGSNLVEVADNGSGIKEDDFEGIALKHHTSKLSSFSDLESVGTFGFRGEALSSLCSLCGGLSVLTCHSSATFATSLEFDSNGLLIKKSPCARQVGTTVSLRSLFSGLPVRRKEFLRHLQREFVKMTHLLYAYCLVSTGVRITCTNRNQQKGSHSTVVVATQGGETIRDNIGCVFGHKQLMTLIDFQQKDVSEEILAEFGLESKSDHDEVMQEECEDTIKEDEIEQITMKSSPYNLTGCVSTCEHGKGRGAPDRQFFFINSRPCECKKAIRLINEVYHQFNSNQNPFVFLDIRTNGTEGCGVDVNVTPDKRKIYIENEKLLLATIKASLLQMYASTPRTFHLQNLPKSFIGNRSMSTIESQDGRTNDSSTPTSSQGSSSSTLFQLPKSSSSLSTPLALRISQALSRFAQSSNAPMENDNAFRVSKRTSDTNTGAINKQPKMDLFIVPKSASSKTPEFDNVESLGSTAVTTFSADRVLDFEEQSVISGAGIDAHSAECKENEDILEKNMTASPSHQDDNNKEITLKNKEDIIFTPNIENGRSESGENCCGDMMSTVDTNEDLSHSRNKNITLEVKNSSISEPICKSSEKTIHSTMRNFSYESVCNIDDHSSIKAFVKKIESIDNDASLHVDKQEMSTDSEIVILDDEDITIAQREQRTVTLNISVADIVSRIQEVEERKRKKNMKGDAGRKGRFNAGITPKENKTAETEMQREITKEMFSKMKVIGQFNLGFVVTKLGSDLFIIDQHASDEKYNFETLQQTTSLQQQPLVVPQPLDMTAAAKSVLLENIEVFEHNGFRFSFPPDDELEDGRKETRVCLTSIPYSRNWTFGKEDVDELIFMLQDSPHTNCRPSRVRDMFASRACRKSVMIGTALNAAEMRRIIDHMGLIDQPWNCPHGRPTMRHLINLHLIASD